uniref:Pseudouridine synthase RsuA/RluA-like domain-containing protein n=1 Tax=Oryza meridionalis TaxID=40149 RepID=A0A0E0E8M1_9ORYZ
MPRHLCPPCSLLLSLPAEREREAALDCRRAEVGEDVGAAGEATAPGAPRGRRGARRRGRRRAAPPYSGGGAAAFEESGASVAPIAVDLAPIVKSLRGLDVDCQDLPRAGLPSVDGAMWKRRRTRRSFSLAIFSLSLMSYAVGSTFRDSFFVHSECSDHEVSVETTKSQKHHLKKWQRARLEMRLRRPVIHKDSAILVLNKPTKVPMKGNLPVHNSMDVLAAAALLYGNEEGSKLVHRQRASLLLATAERGSDRRGGGGRGPDPHSGAQDGSAPGPARRP